MRFCFVISLHVAALFCGVTQAQEPPPQDLLNALVPQLRKKLPAAEISFQSGTATAGLCAMQSAEMTLSQAGLRRAFSILIDPQKETAVLPRQVLARTSRMTVDADGAARAYHPEDPYGQGTCTQVARPDGTTAVAGVCAVDELSNAGVRLFLGPNRILKPHPVNPAQANEPDFAKEWQAIWPLIRDRTLKSFDLTALAGPDVPSGYYLFYWKDRGLTLFFNRDNIPSTRDGYPCVRGEESRYPGYFISATTLTQHGPARADGCTPARYIDAEEIPYFVLPGRTFGHVGVGDAVVGHLKLGSLERIVFGIAADTGPFDQFGEGSIAFNQGLLGKSDFVPNIRGVYALDINLENLGATGDGEPALTILVLGGTRPLFNGDYSRANVEKVGRDQFATWGGDHAAAARRLNACAAATTVNRP